MHGRDTSSRYRQRTASTSGTAGAESDASQSGDSAETESAFRSQRPTLLASGTRFCPQVVVICTSWLLRPSERSYQHVVSLKEVKKPCVSL